MTLESGGTLAVGLTDGIFNRSGPATFTLSGGTIEVLDTHLTTSVPATLTGGTTSTIDTKGIGATFAGSFSGGGGLAKTGAGTLTLSSNNNQFGSLVFSEGTVDLNASSPIIGTVVFDGGTFTNGSLVNTSAWEVRSATVVPHDLGGSGGLTKTGSSTSILTGSNSYAGGTVVSEGTLQIGAGGTGGSIVGNVTNFGTFAFNRSDDFTFNGIISGSGGLVHDGHILRLTAAQTYTGPTSINSGFLVLPTTVNNGLSPSTLVNLSGGASLDISNRAQTIRGLTGSGGIYSVGGTGGSLTLDVASGQTHTFSGALGTVAPSFALFKTGEGTQILAGNNTHTGGTTLDQGTLIAESSSSFGATTGPVVVNGGSLNLGGHSVSTGPVSFNGGTISNGTLNATVFSMESGTFGDAVTLGGPGSFVKTGTGDLTLTGTHHYTGGTQIQGGRLLFSSASNLGDGPISVTDGGSLRYVNESDFSNLEFNASASFDGAGSSFFNALSNWLFVKFTLGEDESLSVLNGASFTETSPDEPTQSSIMPLTIEGGSVLVSGVGSTLGNLAFLELGSSSSPTATTVESGGMLYSGFALSSSGSFDLNDGGILELRGAEDPLYEFRGTTSFSDGIIRTTQNSAKLLRLSSAGPLTLAGTNNFEVTAGSLEIYSPFTGQILAGEGALRKTGMGDLILSLPTGYTGATYIDAGTLEINHGSALQGTSSIDLASPATLHINDYAVTLTVLNGAGTIALGSGILTTGSGDDQSLSGVITGTGDLVKVGSGTLNLSGNSTFTGVTTIDAGTLTIGNGGASGDIAGNINNNASLVFRRSDDYTYQGVISGSGGVISDGAVLRFNAAQTYEGPTTINSGVYVLPFEVTQGLSSSTSVAIASGATLDISNSALTISGLTGDGNVYSFRDNNASAGNLTVDTASGQAQTFSGVLGSSFPHFALSKTGEGVLTLSGANTYTGATTVNQGTLEFNNGLTSPGGEIFITQTGTLAASGTIARNLRNNANVVALGESLLTLTGIISGSGHFTGDFVFAGTTRPGNSPGLLTVDGDLTFGENHVLEAEIGGLLRGTEYDALDITGAADLNGTLRVLLVDNFIPSRGDVFVVVSAASFSAEFTSLDLSGATLPANLRWDVSELSSNGSLRVRGRTFAEWASDFSLEANASEDVLGEGVSLLVKYALGLDPTVRADAADLPDFASWANGASKYLAVRVVRDPAAENVTITAEISNDLEIWSEGEVVLIEETDSVHHFRDSKPLSEHLRRFLRLRFTLGAEE